VACLLLAILLVGCNSSVEPTSNGATLLGLTINGAELDQALKSNLPTFTATVDFAVSSISVRASGNNGAASITLNGSTIVSGVDSTPISLVVGENTATITITAEDGFTTKTYTLLVTRNANSTDETTLVNGVSLSGLTVIGANLDQIFQPNSASYTARANYLTTALSLMPVATVNAASITVNGNAVSSGGESDQISLAEGDNTITVFITAEDGLGTQSYTLYVSRATAADFAQQAFLKASNSGNHDNFGYRVALDGDTLVVGTFGEDSTANDGEHNNEASNAGAVYVFTRSNGSWTQQDNLKASEADAHDIFGISLALDGDTLVVGAMFESTTAAGGESYHDTAYAGAVYVFTRSKGSWSQRALLKARNAEAGDSFGGSVALDGDTLVVSAEEDEEEEKE
jgi:hypothetical protein